jgi:hypothetical protein
MRQDKEKHIQPSFSDSYYKHCENITLIVLLFQDNAGWKSQTKHKNGL